MMLQMLKAKIQEITVSESNINYPGSISLPDEILKASGIKQFELVYVNNKTNGQRIITYAVRSREHGFVSVNGAASKLFEKGDAIHVLSYCYLNEKEAELFKPVLVVTDERNRVVARGAYTLNSSFQTV